MCRTGDITGLHGRVNHRHITDTVSLTHFSGGIRVTPNLATNCTVVLDAATQAVFFYLFSFAGMIRSNKMNSVKAVVLDCE